MRIWAKRDSNISLSVGRAMKRTNNHTRKANYKSRHLPRNSRTASPPMAPAAPVMKTCWPSNPRKERRGNDSVDIVI